MSENSKLVVTLAVTCLIFGAFIGMVLESFKYNDSIIIPKQKLIEQSLAEYDSKTGEFRLKIEVE